jgi:diguanylate cyclase (GGDEF)-like protein/PAS domain S-box-containing protein
MSDRPASPTGTFPIGRRRSDPVVGLLTENPTRPLGMSAVPYGQRVASLGSRWGELVRNRAHRLKWPPATRPEPATGDHRYLDRRLRETLQRSPIGDAIIGIGGYFLEANPALCRMLGYSEPELCSLRLEDVLDVEDNAGRTVLSAALRGQADDVPSELRCFRKDGTRLVTECVFSPITDSASHPVYVIVQMQDVSPQRERDRLAALVDHHPDILAVISADGLLLYASRSYEVMFGADPSEAVGRPVGRRTHPEDVEMMRANLAQVAALPESVATFEFRVADAAGQWVRLEVTASNRLSDPAVGGIVCAGRDVTSRGVGTPSGPTASHDGLTGLPARAVALERIESVVGEARGSKGGCALLLIAIDYFSGLTERYGREVADTVVSTLARRLSSWLRPEDLLARYGDEVFLVVAEGLPSAEAGTALTRRLLEATSPPMATSAGPVPVRTSIGVAVWDGDEPSAWLGHARTALESAKRSGGNRGVLWGPEHQATPAR